MNEIPQMTTALKADHDKGSSPLKDALYLAQIDSEKKDARPKAGMLK